MKSQIIRFFAPSSREKCLILILTGFFPAVLGKLMRGHLRVTVSDDAPFNTDGIARFRTASCLRAMGINLLVYLVRAAVRRWRRQY